MYKLPVWQTVIDAYKFTFGQWLWVLKYATPAIISIVLLRFAFSFALDSHSNDEFFGPTVPGIIFAFFAIWFIGAAIAITFAVAMHRHYLIGPDQRGIWTALRWRSRHWRFLGWAIVVGIGMGILSALFTFPVLSLSSTKFFVALLHSENILVSTSTSLGLNLMGWTIAFLIICPALIRLPLHAIDANDKTFTSASGLVRGNRLRMTAVFLLGDFVPVFVVSVALFSFAGSNANVAPNQPGAEILPGIFSVMAFQAVLGLLWLAVTAVMLSMIYKQLSENAQMPANPAPPLDKTDPA